MLEKGLVIETKGTKAVIQLEEHEACSKCIMKCIKQGGHMLTDAQNNIGAKIGDTVRFQIYSDIYFFAVFMVFGLPLIFFVLGMGIAYLICSYIDYKGNIELMSAGAGFLTFILAFIPARLYNNRLKKHNSCSAVITDIIHSGKAS
ncbi:hypothetical protein GF312_05045 [Candidatus Poribacteria bacterium]|nr:hypothetical protein [Candidatus Poribacteria bacterium]